MRNTSRNIRTAKVWSMVAGFAAIVGCSGIEVTTPESGLPSSGPDLPFGGAPAAGDSAAVAFDPAVVGSWTRILLFTDAAGIQRGSQLTYSFRSDSLFTRTLISSNFTAGIEDTVVESGRWFTSGGNLYLRYNPGQANETSARFSYRIARRSDGNSILLLDDSGFVRD